MLYRAERPPAARRGRRAPALCGLVGRLLLVLVILACLPGPLARLLGSRIYAVVSGSMEPAIPVGSAVYVKPADPAQLAVGEVIAFQSGQSVITHRVVQNDPAGGCILTQGDANSQPDMNPVRYREVIGRVEWHVPLLGALLGDYNGGAGRKALITLALAGALLSLLGGRRPSGADTAAIPAGKGASCPAGGVPGPVAAAARAATEASVARRRRLRRIAMGLLAAVFVFSVGAVLVIRRQGAQQRRFYEDAARQYTQAVPVQQNADAPPISVNFDALCAANSDVAGWLYCEGTPINYPVMHGGTNDDYLRRDADRQYSNAGSIFIEAQNQGDFSDRNTILYGHNMGDGSMFACLSRWQDQAFFDEHPVFWLLTPRQNYRVVLFSAYPTSAVSGTYTIFTAPCNELDGYLQQAAAQSAVHAEVTLPSDAHYLVMSTCASSYGSGLGRHVLHGLLQAVNGPEA